MHKSLKSLFVLPILAMVMLTSCYTEQSLGRRFVKQTVQESPAVWFIGASYLYHVCNVLSDSLTEPCPMLASVSDSAVLEDYNRNFARTLTDLGYKVYNYDESEAFLASGGLSLVVNIAQLELEEVKDYVTDTEEINEYVYTESVPVNVLKINSWIEVSVKDSVQGKQEVFYGTHSIADIVEGYFVQHPIRGDVTYHYQYYSMKPPLTAGFVRNAGNENASALYDIWMNRYIRKHYGDSYRYNYEFRPHYHYDLQKGRIEMIDPSHALKKL